MKLIQRNSFDLPGMRRYDATYEMEPCKRTLICGNEYFYGQFPWTYFYVSYIKFEGIYYQFNSFCIYMAEKQNDMDFYVRFDKHGNARGGVCLSEMSINFSLDITLEKIEEELINIFFTSSFDEGSNFQVKKLEDGEYFLYKSMSFPEWASGEGILERINA